MPDPFVFHMRPRPPMSTPSRSSASSYLYKIQERTAPALPCSVPPLTFVVGKVCDVTVGFRRCSRDIITFYHHCTIPSDAKFKYNYNRMFVVKMLIDVCVLIRLTVQLAAFNRERFSLTTLLFLMICRTFHYHI